MGHHKTLNILITNVCWLYYNEEYLTNPNLLVNGFHTSNTKDKKITEGLERGNKLLDELLRFQGLREIKCYKNLDLFDYFVKKEQGTLRNYDVVRKEKVKIDKNLLDHFSHYFDDISTHKTNFYKTENDFKVGVSKYYFNVKNSDGDLNILKNIMIIVNSKDPSLYSFLKRRMHNIIEYYKKPDCLCGCHENLEEID